MYVGIKNNCSLNLYCDYAAILNIQYSATTAMPTSTLIAIPAISPVPCKGSPVIITDVFHNNWSMSYKV